MLTVPQSEYEAVCRLLESLCEEVERNLGQSAYAPVMTTLPWEVQIWWNERRRRSERGE